MSDTNTHFYRDLVPFHSFVEEAFEPSFYVDLPEDWILVVADITGSTKAVESGKYAEVNYLGAACIVAVTNALDGYSVPTVFGGDGATLAVPPVALSAALDALSATQRWGKIAFDLELRVGAVPVDELIRRGASIQIAKMEFSPGNAMAMFRGNGFDLADDLVKHGANGKRFDVTAPASEDAMPDLESLSCRWAPLRSENGSMLCLIIYARATPEETDDVYRDALAQINGVVALSQSVSSPVKTTNLNFKLRNEGIWKEAKTLPGWPWLNVFKVLPIHLIARFFFGFKKKVGNFDPIAYQHEIAINADFRKVNGMLRLIIDCTEAQCDAVEALLGELRKQGQIAFGAHRATTAIMTCVAPNIKNHEHVHYIDGSEGGLWSAAKALKAQLAEDREG